MMQTAYLHRAHEAVPSSSHMFLRGLWLCQEQGHLCTRCVQVLRSPKEAFAAAMQSWRERCEKCVCLQGDYVEK